MVNWNERHMYARQFLWGWTRQAYWEHKEDMAIAHDLTYGAGWERFITVEGCEDTDGH